MDVLRKIIVNCRQLRRILRIAAPTGHFAVWHSAEFVVLYPKISLQYFRRCREPEQRRVAPG